jgi:hypothetical protein
LVEQQVKKLKDRIASLMLVMVHELKDKKDTDIAPAALVDIERLNRSVALRDPALKFLTSSVPAISALFRRT